MKQVEYTIGDDVLPLIEDSVYQSFAGRIDFVSPPPEQGIIVKTGFAGMRDVNRSIMGMAIRSGLVINASEISNMERMVDDKGVGYISYIAPFLANVRFYVDPSFDPIEAGEDNYYIQGFRKSSYTYRITSGVGEEFEIVATGVREPSGPVKYYWTNWLVTRRGGFQYEQRVMTEHPFYAKTNYSIIEGSVESNQDRQYSLASWQQITKEEYELYNKLQA